MDNMKTYKKCNNYHLIEKPDILERLAEDNTIPDVAYAPHFQFLFLSLLTTTDSTDPSRHQKNVQTVWTALAHAPAKVPFG